MEVRGGYHDDGSTRSPAARAEAAERRSAGWPVRTLGRPGVEREPIDRAGDRGGDVPMVQGVILPLVRPEVRWGLPLRKLRADFTASALLGTFGRFGSFTHWTPGSALLREVERDDLREVAMLVQRALPIARAILAVTG